MDFCMQQYSVSGFMGSLGETAMEKGLYSWQEECLERWFANNGRGIVQAVTGAGKTRLALAAAERLEKMLGRQILVKIVVPTASLMWQWNRSLREYLSLTGQSGMQAGRAHREIGLRGGGRQTGPGCKYMVYVVNSARYELARQILTELRGGETVFLIADECHHYESAQNRLIFEFLPYIKAYEQNFYSLGLTATLPFGQAQHYLASVLGQKVYSYGMARASALRTVCQYDIYHIGLSFLREEQDEYEELTERMKLLYQKLAHAYPFLSNMGQKERYEMLRQLSGGKNQEIAQAAAAYMGLTYKRKDLVCMASARVACANDLAGRLLERMPQNERLLVFGERISQAEELYQLLHGQYPGRIGRYHSKLGPQANKNALERFRMGDTKILVTCKAMDEGVDIPDASGAIILSGTSTQRQRIQRLGRIIRRKEGMGRASLYYLHIAESSEDSCFLPPEAENSVYELEYFPQAQAFHNPLYDKAADRLLDKMRGAGASRGQLDEARRCLRLGSVRLDWKLESSAVNRKIDGAKYASDRNYWVCMKKLGAFIINEQN